MFGIFLTILHVVVAVFLVMVVLLQTGKRADLAGAFGGGGSQTAFGSRGAATVLSKATTAAAVLFMLTSLGLSLVSSKNSGSGGTALDSAVPEVETTLPAPDGLGGDLGGDLGGGLPPVEPSVDDLEADPAATEPEPGESDLGESTP